MANEAVKIELTNGTGNPRRFTCADTPAITKGSLLKFTDPRTAAQSAAAGDPCAGIAAMDKVASDGSLSITAYTDGIFEMVCSGAVLVGNPIRSAGIINQVMDAGLLSGAASASGAAIIGYALETGADRETIAVRLRL